MSFSPLQLKEKVGKMDLSSLTCIEELGTVDSLSAFEISVGGEKYILGTAEERQTTAWFEAFSLVQKHLVGGVKETTHRPTPDKKGWLMKRLGGEDVGSTAIWKSRWCELYEDHLELYDNEKVGASKQSVGFLCFCLTKPFISE